MNIMKKTLLLCALAFALPVMANNSNANTCREQNHGGSALTPDGKVLQVNVFVSAKGKPSWTRAQKDEIMGLFPTTESWLNRELSRYGKKVRMTYQNYGYDTDVKVATIPKIDKNNDVWDDKSLKLIGFKDEHAFYDAMKKQYAFDQMYIVYFINAENTSYANVENARQGEPHFVESIKMFGRYDGLKLTDRAEIYTLAHEILHLFGAIDLYEGEQQSAKTENLAIKHARDSVMLGSSRFLDKQEDFWSIDRYKLDTFSAYQMNLHGQTESWYESLAKKCADFARMPL